MGCILREDTSRDIQNNILVVVKYILYIPVYGVTYTFPEWIDSHMRTNIKTHNTELANDITRNVCMFVGT